MNGEIITAHLDIREFSIESWRDVIGVVPQDPVLFTGTIASNIAYGNKDATREQIEQAAREANCEFVWGMPQGFDTPSENFVLPLRGRTSSHYHYSRTVKSKRWPAATPRDCARIAQEAGVARA
jgi:ABC-type transport system involved in Fe-S cluster assembly fused permease/ATPase subunit